MPKPIVTAVAPVEVAPIVTKGKEKKKKKSKKKGAAAESVPVAPPPPPKDLLEMDEFFSQVKLLFFKSVT